MPRVIAATSLQSAGAFISIDGLLVYCFTTGTVTGRLLASPRYTVELFGITGRPRVVAFAHLTGKFSSR